MAEITTIGAPKATFQFRLSGSKKVWSLPLMGSLPVKTSRRIAKMAEAETEPELLDDAIEIFDELCPGLTDVVTTDQLAEVMTAWRDASGVGPGESRASSD